MYDDCYTMSTTKQTEVTKMKIEKQSNGTYKVVDTKNQLSRIVDTKSYAEFLKRKGKLI